jgi:pantothenate synthetase
MEESPNAAALAQRLDEGAIWRASRKDQEELWRFVANLRRPAALCAAAYVGSTRLIDNVILASAAP